MVSRMNIGILGSGEVARTLGRGFLMHGRSVMLGSGTPAKLQNWHAENVNGRIGTFAEAAQYGDALVLAVKGSVAAEVLRMAGREGLAGKPVIDTTNPIDSAPSVNGVLKYFSTLDDS